MKIAYNIGYSGHFGNGVLNLKPYIWDEDNFKSLSDSLRKEETILDLFELAKNRHVPPSDISIFLQVLDDKYEKGFIIKMINVREYRAYWEDKYKTIWKDFSQKNI